MSAWSVCLLDSQQVVTYNRILLIKLINTVIYRFIFAKTLKNWISCHIVRFYEIFVLLCNQTNGLICFSITCLCVVLIVTIGRQGNRTSFSIFFFSFFKIIYCCVYDNLE